MPDSCERLYVVVRADLSPGAQLAQTAHAVADFMLAFPRLCRVWAETSHSVVVVAVAGEGELLEVAAHAAGAGVETVVFREPDLAGEATCVALAPRPAARRVCSRLALAGRDHPDAEGARRREAQMRACGREPGTVLR